MCDCIKVSFTYDGVDYEHNLQKTGIVNGKNEYVFSDVLNIFSPIVLNWNESSNVWIIQINNYETGEVAVYIQSTDNNCPIFNDWVDDGGDFQVENLTTTECIPPRKTVTYSMVSTGWNSFWSYQPDWMAEMNSTFYTFKGGELWKHNVNTTRNNFYGQQYQSSIRTIFNTDPLTVKMFNTVSLNSTHAWTANVYTNINEGSTEYQYFVEKEGQWFAYIRRFDDTIDVKALSTQGVGSANSVDSSTPSAVVAGFTFKLDASISVGDKLYKNSSGNLVLIGTITNLSSNSITVDTTLGSIPLTSDFLICIKNSQAESFGARGYYMNIYLENDLTEQVKLFAVGTSLFKSYM